MTGLGGLLHLAWRRSRLFWVVWVIALASLMPLTVTKYEEIVPPGLDARTFLAQLSANPTMRALLGPPHDLGTPGGFAFWRVGTFTAAAAAMMAALGVIRATRAEEEEGRLELLRAGAVGRRAPLTAALLLALLGCLATGLATTGLMVAADTPVAGAALSGAGIGLTGAMFVGVGAVAAQVFESARSARSWSLGLVLGGLYFVRAMIDGAGGDSDWASRWRWAVPLEWAALARPYAGDRWWVMALPLAVTTGLVALAYALEARRDHGAGLVAVTPGRSRAAAYLSGAWGLAWRLQRGGIIGWSIGIVVSALGMGTLALSIDSIVEGNAQLAEMFRRMGGGASALKDAFFQAMLGIMATLLALCGAQILGRLRQEEQRGHAEQLLATATSRWTLAASHVVWALIVPCVLLVATGALMPVSEAVRTGDAGVVGTVAGAAGVLVPGVALVLGLAMFLLGWLPRAYAVVWALLGWSMFVSWIGALMGLPDWLLKLHPWGHLPHLPSDPLTWGVIVAESAVGLGLLALGLVGFRRRGIGA